VGRRSGGTLATLAAGAALLTAAGLAGVAAGSAGSVAEDAPRGGTLRIWSHVDVDSIDPALGYLRNAWLIADASCARLFRSRTPLGSSSARVVPEVARSYAVSRDRRTYTFTLKRSFRFHTGARVTAQSFADAFDRDAKAPLSPAQPYLREIVGAVAVIDGDAESISGIRVLARDRLQIRLTKPIDDLLARLTMPFFCPVAPGTPPPGPATVPAGSGPYYVAMHVFNQQIVLRRNPYYGGERPASVDQIVWTIGNSLEACRLAVDEDRADLCGEPGAPATEVRGLAEKYGINRPGGRFFVSPSRGTWFFVFNHDRPAFRGAGQIPLKKAINYAIDRPALVRPFGFLSQKRTDQLLPPVFARAASIYPLVGADPATARRWYAKARYKPEKLVLYTWNFPPAVAGAQVLAYDLAQVGIQLEVKYFDPDTVYARMLTPGEPYDIALQGWAADYPDPAGFLVAILAPRGALHLAVDPRVRDRVDAANRLTGEARLRAFADLDVELMRDDPPWAPFANTQFRTFVSPSIGCFHYDALLGMEITALCKKR